MLLLVACQKERSGPEFRSRSEGPLVSTVRESINQERYAIDYTYDAQRRIVGVTRYRLDVDDTPYPVSAVSVTYAPGRVKIAESSKRYKGIVETDVRLGSNGLLASAIRKYIYIQDQSEQATIRTEKKEAITSRYDAGDRLSIFSYNGNISQEKWDITPENQQTRMYEKLQEAIRSTSTFDRSQESLLTKRIVQEFVERYFYFGQQKPEQRYTSDLTQEISLTPYRNTTNMDFTVSNHDYPSFPAPFASTLFLSELGLMGEICPYVPQQLEIFTFLSEFDDEGLLKKVSGYIYSLDRKPTFVWEFTYMK